MSTKVDRKSGCVSKFPVAQSAHFLEQDNAREVMLEMKPKIGIAVKNTTEEDREEGQQPAVVVVSVKVRVNEMESQRRMTRARVLCAARKLRRCGRPSGGRPHLPGGSD